MRRVLDTRANGELVLVRVARHMRATLHTYILPALRGGAAVGGTRWSWTQAERAFYFDVALVLEDMFKRLWEGVLALREDGAAVSGGGGGGGGGGGADGRALMAAHA